MSELFDKSIRTLELPRVLQLLSDQAVSTEAKEKALRIRPETETEEVLRLLDQTDAARAMIGLHGAPSFSGVKPVGEALDRADRGGSLNTKELLTIADLLTAARRAKEYFNADAMEKTAIDHLFLSLHGNRFLEEKIKRCIPDEDTIADAASTELADIRRHMRAAQAKSRQILQKIISSPTYGKILQETIITQRDGRFVVPVKAEHKGDLPGLVHDISSSGATLFVEPMGVVQANNELIELEAKEQKEIERILAELSAEAAAHREDIQWDYDALVHLDLIFARGQLSYNMDGIRPEVRRDGAIQLRKARHPLLDPKKAVPIDIELGDTFDTLVITGPNTGGKTVSLKTLGLLTLMTQCGLHIPVGDRSAVSVYERVLADIGDEQSIEQNLSTFSAHMTNIVSILAEADRHSLILFDELGAGTDPVEGAALAIAVIQHVRRMGARVAATTHYAELKTFAMTTAGVENASCEFNVETLSPTYRLLIGIPGKSNAFAISKRLGLPDEVIEAAKVQMSGESIRFEDVLTQLEAKRQALEKREQEANRLYHQREEDARKAREFREQMERAKENARSRGEAEAKRILRDARSAADEVFAELAEMRKQQAKAERTLNANEARSELRRKLNEAEDAVSKRDQRQEPIPKPSRPIREGDLVEIPGVRTPAEVVSVGKDGTLQLKSGVLKMKAKADEVRLIEEDERAAQKKKPAVSIRQNADRALRASASRELDIRGMETLEAESVVENFLSAAVMGRLDTVTIIHGKGTGALRKAVHDILRRSKAVKSFRLGVYGEGESGVTVVTLK
ncbi:endonuclease MutS2 [Pseudoflavonifractor capillosus]|uniref:endonuclease MutS2 n=1 Tax=Pseudoflavonifractor capillosus TaxID=106588 RepID=UPI002A82AE8F|nr:endonuclease MutS2 [Pseudoflavonifractor capillosus]MDY4660185.1 endonuclease MutS2 [Pseudoflavonifractor capillosus]